VLDNPLPSRNPDLLEQNPVVRERETRVECPGSWSSGEEELI
jgi:hypothetical protein